MLKKILIIILIAALIPVCAFGSLTAKFIDVGQGNAVLFESQGHYMLVDAGPNESSGLMSFIQTLPQLDYVIASNPNDEHIGGMDAVLSAVPVTTYVDAGINSSSPTYEKLKQKIIDNQIPYMKAKAGDSWIFGDTMVHVISPENSSDDSHNQSLAVSVQDGSVSFLLPGDDETITSSATVLLVPNHGREGSVEKIANITPEIAVISVGTGNPYIGPAKKTLKKLTEAKVLTYRTDLDGSITVRSDGATYTAIPSKKAGN